MPIGKNSDKIFVIVSKKDKKKIEEKADKENRSISNWVYNLIKKELR